MSIQVFGHRALIEWWKPESESRLIQPDISGQHDVLRWGKVSAVGDGKLNFSVREQLAGRGFQGGPIQPLVALGDRVCFEINDMIKYTQVYKRWRDKKDMIQLLQTDLIGRLKDDRVNIESFEILGDFVLVKPELRGSGSPIVLPSTVAKSPEFVYYRVVQLGSTVDLPIAVGDEIIINHGKVNVLMLQAQDKGGGWHNEDYGYVIKDYVHAVVSGVDEEVEAEDADAGGLLTSPAA
jgi:hypothetical protein